MKKIKLSRGKYAIVDNEDFEKCSLHKYYCDSTGYAVRNCKRIYKKDRVIRPKIALHNFIMKPEKGKMCDHINGNKLDCRKKNLRIVTRSQNCFNRKLNKNSSTGYKGVSLWRGKFRASINKDKHRYWLGIFSNPDNAAEAYNKAAKELHGVYAKLNKIKRNGKNKKITNTSRKK